MSAARRLRLLARRQAAELSLIHARGAYAMGRIGLAVERAAIHAYQQRTDPTRAIRALFERMVPVLRSGMVLSRLHGRSHVLQLAPRRRSALERAGIEDVFGTAVSALQRRLGLRPGDVARMEQQMGATALRIVGATSLDAEQRVQRVIAQAIADGVHVREGVKRLRQAFEAEGIVPRHRATLETIFRTHTQIAYAAGKQEMERSAAIDAILWGYTYVTVGDDRVRDEHAELDGVTLPKDDPFWLRNYPPNGWNCRCSVIPVFEPAKPVAPPPDMTGAASGFQFAPADLFRPLVA